MTRKSDSEAVIINEDYRLELYDGPFKGNQTANIQVSPLDISEMQSTDGASETLSHR